MASNLESLQQVLTERAVFVHDDTFAKASLTSDHARTIKGIQFLPSSSASSLEEIIPKAPYVVKSPEKKHRLSFAYNRFMRTSPSAFIVPYSLYMESVKNNHSIGMRFKMRFEVEEAPEQRFTGTIVGIGDIDSSLWPGSEWRCFKVRWDENSSIPAEIRAQTRKINRYNMPRRAKRLNINDGNESHGDEQPLHNSGSQTEEGEGSTPPTVKKHRGWTKMTNVWRLQNDERIEVEANGVGQPVGDNASKFSSFIGVIARNPRILPLSYESWPKVPTTTKATAITTIKQYFSFADSLTPWVEKSLSKKWRNHKSELKSKFYNKDLSEEENAVNVPENVEPSDWQFLVHYWISAIGQKRAEVGAASRSKQLVLHTAGTQSFALVREELAEDLGGLTEFGDIDFFDATHKSKDGTYASPEAARILTNARKRYDEISSASDLDPTAPRPDWRTRQRVALTDVRGKERHGRVRGMGLGPTPSRLFGRSPSSSSGNHDEEMIALKAQVALLQEQMANLIGQQSQVPPRSGRPDEENSDDQN